jgi:hypothetical protein
VLVTVFVTVRVAGRVWATKQVVVLVLCAVTAVAARAMAAMENFMFIKFCIWIKRV